MTTEAQKRGAAGEKRAARTYGGRRNPGSGNQGSKKNDIRTPTLSIEYKSTGRGQYAIKRWEIEQAIKNALLDGGRMGIFGIEFVSPKEKAIRIALLEEGDLQFLLRRVSELEKENDGLKAKIPSTE
jgi:hypothetical protein